ncbi:MULTISPECIES: RND family transporter [unclassified Mycolicibacterium]|uniref:MMPL/RND family transporter n=1 Tax=unclassified Mycolicibacterium TaxID=2636767 RepID=UPI0012DEA3A3|nr:MULTISPECIES: MMPL family transporter [unclassified Mycolicibacterium]MUL85559.1 MMPL family transporter [Mycolicibacterium sp. CBMA 329]MUL88677.1 MMPL family transporter [Mycolicibacterium sp. CBMA 331]MUM02028.1 MMPL family transporter [Mycolicibacterium sp. CBMA 334]MUM40324.1 MMPL family transporter [Mycolicibacterium sp. CBMA 247]MUM44741.1 MMPL family transporter [Mycolicibacterium sp. CBMA 294]
MSTHDAPTDAIPVTGPRPAQHGGIAKWIRRLSIPIIIGWIVLIGILNTVVPQLEEVGKMRSVSMSPDQAPSMIAMKRVGEVFQEFKSNSSVMVVLEGEQPLDIDAHKYYDQVVAKLEADKQHVEHVQDFWGDPLTASGAQSSDGKASYVQVYTAGNQGEALANESVEAVQKIVESVQAPPGVKAYVTGPAALAADQHIAGDRSMKMIEALTFTVIIIMLLLVYRSIITVILTLVMVVLSLSAARGVIAFLGYYNIIGLSTFATNLLVTLAIAAATDYAIFLIGRYQEARGAGEDREQAYYTMFHGTAHVVLGSGLTIAGATLCLHFTNLPYFQSLGIPLAIGMVMVVVAALTLGSAIITVATKFGKTLEPKRAMRTRGWRKIGAAVVRWPGPILIATIALSLIGLLTLPGYRTNYNDRQYLPADLPANTGYAASDRHFSQARMNPELLLIESDHDLRNSADFLVVDRIAKRIFQVPGISRVQAITRPQGTPIEHTSIPFQISMQGTTQMMNMKYMQDRMKDMLKMADEMQTTVNTMEQMLKLVKEMSDTTHSMVGKMHAMVTDVAQMRDHIADFDDFFRPIRNYLYWEPKCFNIPMCWSMRSIFDTLDGIDTMTDDIQKMMPDMDRLDELMPQMLTIMPPMIATMKTMKSMMLTMQATMGGLQDQMEAMMKDQTAMGQAFDASKNDDSFYLPPETFDNPDFKRGMKMFLSPDGHAVRFIISHEGDPMSPEGISHIDAIKNAAKEAIKGTPLEGSKIFLGGTAATFKDMQEGANYDLLIAGIAALCLIFIIMLILTRSVVAAAVIVGTVVLSLGASFGLSVLIWQHLIGLELHWMVIAMAVIVLLAVGADYNLLLVSRFKEEIHAGLNTGIIRAMGGTGSVVTSAGLVFAFTMMSMAISELAVIGQVGTTIGLGLLFDTLVIRSFMTPSIAALMGKWFWWPQRVRQRPLPAPWPTPVQRDPQDALV